MGLFGSLLENQQQFMGGLAGLSGQLAQQQAPQPGFFGVLGNSACRVASISETEIRRMCNTGPHMDMTFLGRLRTEIDDWIRIN